MTGECRLDDDGHGEMIAIEAGDKPQALWLRPGIVYDGDVVRAEPGVWITYQEHYMHSDLAGPVLLTPEVWDQLVRAMSKRLRAQGRSRIMKRIRRWLDTRRARKAAFGAGHDTVMHRAADEVMEKRLHPDRDAFDLARRFVHQRPQAPGFRAEADAEIKAATEGLGEDPPHGGQAR